MTLREQLFIEKLPENGFNMSKTMRAVGYTESTSNSGVQYKSLRKLTKEFWSPEQTKRKIRSAQRLFLKQGDNSNYARMLELEAKSTLKTEQAGQINAITAYLAPVDKSVSKQEQGKDIPVDNLCISGKPLQDKDLQNDTKEIK